MRWIFAVTMAVATVSVQADNYSEDPRLRRLITDWVLDYRMPKGWLQRQFINVEKQDGVLERFNRQAESMPWFRYRPIFDNDERALLGAAFWQEHAETLARAQAEYGVPAAVIVAVIGVETKYGTITGSFRAIDALTTLALDYPRRSEFFTNELRELLLLALEENREASSFTGSYAGAMGLGQFIPSSYR
ncbi:MAG: lytic murein transglycosylase, partial [Litorivicinus sp.]